MYSKLPSLLKDNVPLLVLEFPVADRVPPSPPIESFVKTPEAEATVRVVSSLTKKESSTASGTSLTTLTVIVTVAVSVLPSASAIEYVNESDPLKSAVGV